MPVATQPSPSTGSAGRLAPVVGLTGAKGGVGTTLLASSLGWSLAEQGLRVVLMDMDRLNGQAALHLCERNAGPTLREALLLIERLDETLLDTLLTPCGGGLRLLPAPRQWLPAQDEPACSAAHLTHLVRTARALADVVLLDLPASALADEALLPLLAAADEAVLVGEPTLPATFNARRGWATLLQARSGARDGRPAGACRFVLNKVARHHALPVKQVRRTIGLDEGTGLWQELPRSDAAAAQATYQGRAVGAVDGRDPLARALARWAEQWAQGSGALQAQRPAGWRERLQRWAQ